MTRLVVPFVALLLIVGSAAQAKNPVTDHLLGSWSGSGSLFGREAAFQMTWESVLGDRFLQLSFRNGMKTADGVQPVLEATALYKILDGGRLEGTWYDTRGVVQPLQGSLEDSMLTVLWGTAETEQGKTSYRVLANGSVAVEDFVLREGNWTRFGEALYSRNVPQDRRSVAWEVDGRWIGDAISYGPHRDGQFPGGPGPSKAELSEDLRILSQHWSLIRVYGSVGVTEDLLELIRAEGHPIRVMVGAWIAVEETLDEDGNVVEVNPEIQAANRREVETAVRLAAEYPEIVVAISVGNETQVFWTGHRSRPEVLVRYLRQARAGSTVPVTTADDFNFWNKPESHAMAAEVDFITLHLHPLWNGIQREDALGWIQEVVASVRANHPGREVILGETGWATQRHTEGEEAKLMKGTANEAEQAKFHAEVTAWARSEKLPLFFFEAFDENWKGPEHPNAVEKHWGLFNADRTPKKAMRR